jgi:hypothetical protein
MGTHGKTAGFVLEFALKLGKVTIVSQRFVERFDHHRLMQKVVSGFEGDAKPPSSQFFIKGVLAVGKRFANKGSHSCVRIYVS